MTHTVESLIHDVYVGRKELTPVAFDAIKSALRESLRAEYLRGIDAALKEAKDCHFLQATNNQNHPTAFYDGVSAAVESILALKEQP
jgi:hypothetical protein